MNEQTIVDEQIGILISFLARGIRNAELKTVKEERSYNNMSRVTSFEMKDGMRIYISTDSPIKSCEQPQSTCEKLF